MMTSARVALALLMTGALGACASAEPSVRGRTGPDRTVVRDAGGVIEVRTEASVAERTIDIPSAAVWAVLPSVYEELGVPESLIDPIRKELGNRGYRARRIEGKRMSQYFRCGNSMTGALADEYNLVASVVTRITDEPNGKTKITTTVDAIGRPRATSGNPVRCESSGTLESRVVGLILENLGRDL